MTFYWDKFVVRADLLLLCFVFRPKPNLGFSSQSILIKFNFLPYFKRVDFLSVRFPATSILNKLGFGWTTHFIYIQKNSARNFHFCKYNLSKISPHSSSFTDFLSFNYFFDSSICQKIFHNCDDFTCVEISQKRKKESLSINHTQF